MESGWNVPEWNSIRNPVNTALDISAMLVPHSHRREVNEGLYIDRGATLKSCGGGLTSDSKWGAENTFFLVTLYNLHKCGRGAEAPPPEPLPLRGLSLLLSSTNMALSDDKCNRGIISMGNRKLILTVKQFNPNFNKLANF